MSVVRGNTAGMFLCNTWLILFGFLSVMTEVFGGFCFHRQIPCYYFEVKCYLISNRYLLTMYDHLIIIFDSIKRVFCYSECPTCSRVHPAAIQWVPGALISEVNCPGHEADHSPQSSPEVKISWSFTFPLMLTLVVCCLITHTDNFMFSSAMYMSRYVGMKICVCHNVGTAAKCYVTCLETENKSCISDTGHEILSSRWS